MAQIWHNFGIFMACFTLLSCYPLFMRNLTYDLFIGVIDCSFITNLEDAGIRSAPILYKRINILMKF